MANQLSRAVQGGVGREWASPSLPPSLSPLMRLKQIMSGSSSAFALHAKKEKESEPRCVLTHPEFNSTLTVRGMMESKVEGRARWNGMTDDRAGTQKMHSFWPTSNRAEDQSLDSPRRTSPTTKSNLWRTGCLYGCLACPVHTSMNRWGPPHSIRRLRRHHSDRHHPKSPPTAIMPCWQASAFSK